MYLTYLQFCRPSSPFYEHRDDEDPRDFFPLHRAAVPEGWHRRVNGEWVMYSPGGTARRLQGWKIHTTATADNAAEILNAVAGYCTRRGIAFKALSSPSTLGRRNSKYADRGGSGKFVTLYPDDDTVFAAALRDLDARIGGADGPTILSDLRFREGPLYVRYGAFVSRRVVDASGRQVECIEDPDGNLVPDERRPGFHPPAWAPVPEVLRESLDLRASRTLSGFPYTVRRALHFSNGGGVYLAARTDGTDRTVLLKEARPHCGLDESGRDAVARLEREREALLALAGLPGVPEVDAYVEGVEHRFLGRAYIDGDSLMNAALQRNPFANPDSPWSPGDYAAWARTLLEQVTDAVEGMHARGWVFGDLHPGNLIVDSADRVHFIDFESASRDVTGYAQTMGVFGFRAPIDYRGGDVDRFALGAMRLALLLPLTRLLPLGPDRARELARSARERFGLERGYFDGLADQLGPRDGSPRDGGPRDGGPRAAAAGPARPASAGDAPDRRPGPRGAEPEPPGAAPGPDPFGAAALAAALRAWRSPDRADRLFPGDVRQFLEPSGGLGLAYGAAGCLWALHRAGGAPDPEDIAWLRRLVHADTDLPPGFWSGLSGIAFATEDLDPAFSRDCEDRALRRAADTTDLSLGRGLSGLGCQLLRRPDRLDAAAALAARVADAVASDGAPADAGLLQGASGAAVFLLRAADALDADDYRKSAGDLLELEVERFGPAPGGAVAPAALPALGTGITSGVLGLALALGDHVRSTGPERFGGVLARLLHLARTTTALHNGLLNGRAGQIQLLTAAAPDDPATGQAVRRVLAEANWHLTPLGSGRVPLGDEALKLSLDLGTGLAGLAVTARAAERGAATLPLWDGPGQAAA